ncbi:uncharacterized protein [Engystomops pustulosus]
MEGVQRGSRPDASLQQGKLHSNVQAQILSSSLPFCTRSPMDSPPPLLFSPQSPPHVRKARRYQASYPLSSPPPLSPLFSQPTFVPVQYSAPSSPSQRGSRSPNATLQTVDVAISPPHTSSRREDERRTPLHAQRRSSRKDNYRSSVHSQRRQSHRDFQGLYHSQAFDSGSEFSRAGYIRQDSHRSRQTRRYSASSSGSSGRAAACFPEGSRHRGRHHFQESSRHRSSSRHRDHHQESSRHRSHHSKYVRASRSSSRRRSPQQHQQPSRSHQQSTGRSSHRESSKGSPQPHQPEAPQQPASQDQPQTLLANPSSHPTAANGVQRTSRVSGRVRDCMPPILMEPGREQFAHLIRTSISSATWQKYSVSWSHWLLFSGGTLPAERSQLLDNSLNWLLQIRRQGASFNKAKSSLAGLSFMLKLHNRPDITKDFIFKQILKGWKREKVSHDSRRPVSLPLFGRLISILDIVCSDAFEASLFKAAFSIAFFGALRIGELVPLSATRPGGLLSRDVIVKQDSVKVCIRRSKTDFFGRGTWFSILPLGADPCPVTMINSYERGRPAGNNFLVHISGTPLSRFQFGAVFKKSLLYLGLNPKEFGTHSFRIGAATTAHSCGMSEESIKRLGRWKSDCFKSYIRPDLDPLL